MQTKGQYRVGIAFNPSGNPQVDELKRTAADFIDLIEKIECNAMRGSDHSNEVARCKAMAQSFAEDAAMWAVKAATKPGVE